MIELGSRSEAAWRVLAGVLDPEVPALSVVDLGIVRGVEVRDDGVLEVVLTPTYSGCPAVEVIEADVVAALEAASLGPVRVRRQFAPTWTTDWISDEGRSKLREYGIAPPATLRQAQGERRFIPVRAEPVLRQAQDDRGLRQAQPERVVCPRCASFHTERLSAFGATACKALWRCLDCREPFEHFKPI